MVTSATKELKVNQTTCKDQEIIDNFIGTIDKRLPLVYHIRNAVDDSKRYGWTETFLRKLIAELNKEMSDGV